MTAIDTTNTDLHSMLLKGKTALITGGNSGIGLATARRFVAEGARVAITGRDAATLAAAANELGVTAIKSDVLDRQARSSLFDRIKNEFGHLDILFANAGIAKFSPIEETLEKDFDDVLRTNVRPYRPKPLRQTSVGSKRRFRSIASVGPRYSQRRPLSRVG